VSGGVLLGRTTVRLDPKHIVGGVDQLYTAQRLDGETASGVTFQHCTFANISFKAARLYQCRFVDCAFLDCYFRDTTIQNCSFEGCKFEDCTFSEPQFADCTFKFPDFRRCHIPFKFFGHALPLDPGYRHRIADDLAREAAAAGAASDARRYRLQGQAAYERHLWNLAWASGDAYYQKPRTSLDRVTAGLGWIGRKFNRYLWGYGERGLTLARSFVLVGAVIFPLLFWLLVRSDLSQGQDGLSLVDYLLFSFDNLLNASGFSGVSFSGALAAAIVGIEVLVGLLFIGLFISLVFNWIRRR
jgi:hypothetical protein